MNEDFQQGFSGQASGPNTDANEYVKGQNARAANELQRAKMDADIKGLGSSSSTAAAQVGGGGTGADTSGIRDTGYVAGYNLVKHPLKSLKEMAVILIVWPLVAGAIGGVAALLLGGPPATWAALAWAATFALTAFFCVLLLVGVAIGLLPLLLAWPFVIWRWLLGFGLVGAVLGYGMVLHPSATLTGAQDSAISAGLLGMAVGFVIGTLFRLTRAIARRSRAR